MWIFQTCNWNTGISVIYLIYISGKNNSLLSLIWPSIGNSNICIRLNASHGASSIDIFFSWWFCMIAAGSLNGNLQATYMDVASYYPRVPNECYIQRTTATFIRKSIGHIVMFYKKMYLAIPLRLCRRPLYAYFNWCGSVLNRLFYQQPISICTIKLYASYCQLYVL